MLGRKLGAVGNGAHPASVPVPGRLPEQHARASCGACEGSLRRETIPHLLCALRPPRAVASVVSGPARPRSAAICQMLFEAPTLQGRRRPVGTCELRDRHVQHVRRNTEEEYVDLSLGLGVRPEAEIPGTSHHCVGQNMDSKLSACGSPASWQNGFICLNFRFLAWGPSHAAQRSP